MADIPMRARVAFVHEGRALTAGESFNVPAVTAAVLRYQGRADFATATPTPAPRKKRTYQRRDLRAES